MRLLRASLSPHRFRLSTSLAALGLAFVAIAACGSGPSAPTPRVLPDLSTAATASAAVPPSAAASGAGASSAGSPVAGGAVAVDPSLLSFVPIGGNGLVQSVDPDTTAQVAADPALRANATGLIIAVYTIAATASSAAGSDIAVVSVVRLRDPSFGDDWFRDWRDSYDRSACANAGGVVRNAETEIATHQVFIGSCAGGSFTYHTRVADGAIVISITAVGPGHLGETIMERLAP